MQLLRPWDDPPRDDEGRLIVPVAWEPRDYQFPLWNFMEGGGKRAVAIWHRRAGKDTLSLNVTVTQALLRPGLYWHLLPTYNQGRKIVWDGRSKEGRPFLSYWPTPMIRNVNNTDMKLELYNDSIWQVVGTDNVDRLVGSNPVGCVFSEYSLQDPRAWDYIRPILAENDGWAMFIYTPRGMNHGFQMLELAKRNPKWFCQVLTVDDTNVITPEAIQDERDSGMSEEMIQQEFYCSFKSSLVGSYYGAQISRMYEEKRIGDFPWVPQLPVYTGWDLGMDDYTAIWFFQIMGSRVRFIDYYDANGELIGHYITEMRKKPYVYTQYHYGPHDLKVRELFGTGQNAKTRFQIAWELGLRYKIIKKHEIADGIEAVRHLLSTAEINEKPCFRGLEAIKGYRKEYDEVRKIYLAKPEHDWTSHASDAMRIAAMGLRISGEDSRKALPRTADGEYDVLSY